MKNRPHRPSTYVDTIGAEGVLLSAKDSIKPGPTFRGRLHAHGGTTKDEAKGEADTSTTLTTAPLSSSSLDAGEAFRSRSNTDPANARPKAMIINSDVLVT